MVDQYLEEARACCALAWIRHWTLLAFWPWAGGRTLVITASRCLKGRRYKDDVMLKKKKKNQKNIHIKSTECQFLKVLNGMCSLRYIASKSLEKIGQNRVLV